MNTFHATLKSGRDKPVRLGHPWIFSGAVASWSSAPKPGAEVDVVSSDGEWLARGLASPHGQLAVRLYSRDPDTPLDEAFFCQRLRDAMAFRAQTVIPQEPDTNAFRLCFSEADGLSGLVVDQYAGCASVQVNTSLLSRYLPAMIAVLEDHGLETHVRYDADAFSLEGGAALPTSVPEAHPAEARPRMQESGFLYEVDTRGGQKTGFYLDQRVNRRRVAAYARGRRCLGAYCYTGGFEVPLAHAGAAGVTGLDRSEAALAQARANEALNPGGAPIGFLAADVPAMLRRYRDARTDFDLIVLDPPKFVHHQGQLEKGLRAYKDINLLAMKLLTPGGILATFSCSGWVKHDVLLTAIAWAGQDAGRTIRILERLGQPPDHPVLVGFPESAYLCGFILRVD